MGIPILSDLLQLVDTAVDKIFPDANKKEEIKAKLKTQILEQALQEQKLVFQDLQNARELAKAELKEKGVYNWVRSVRALVRPFIAYSTIAFFILAKWKGIQLSNMDYAMFMTIMTFYFGLRTIEKRAGAA